MFRNQLISMVFVWLICVFACAWMLLDTNPEAKSAYQSLVSLNSQAKAERIKEKKSPTKQSRIQVSKQILYTKEHTRLQSRLASDQSELIFDEQGSEADIVEYFSGLTCAVQETGPSEKKLEPGQLIRLLNARQAVYSYKKGEMEASDASMAEYLVPGEKWPVSFQLYTPLLKGQAQNVHLSLFNEPSLKAQGFQATLFDWEEGG